ncbi:MAG: DNA polymerase III subunit gamma/tau [Phycisphaerales bacterium]
MAKQTRTKKDVESEDAESKGARSKGAESKSAESKSAGSKSAGSKSAGSKSAGSKSAESKNAESGRHVAPSTSMGEPPAASPDAGYVVLARRYRSRGFDELVGQEAIARTLRNAIAQNRVAHAYLFTGTRGVGKTSTARIFAKALNVPDGADGLAEREAIAAAILRGDDMDVIEIDGASNRGIDNARELIAGASLLPARCPYKIYIIDEVHQITKDAFNALLKTMEEPPPHVKFILCTTEPQKVPPTIQSRCQRFDFRSIPASRIAAHLRDVLGREGVAFDEQSIMQVARLANGSMRDALSLLDRLLAGVEARPDAADGRSGGLDASLVERLLGLPDASVLHALVEAFADGDAAAALRQGDELLQRGNTVEQGLEALAEHFRTLMIAGVCGAESDLLERAGEARAAAVAQSRRFGAAELVHRIALCEAAARSARSSSSPRAVFDALLVRLALGTQLLAGATGGAGATITTAAGAGPGATVAAATGAGSGATPGAISSAMPSAMPASTATGVAAEKKKHEHEVTVASSPASTVAIRSVPATAPNPASAEPAAARADDPRLAVGAAAATRSEPRRIEPSSAEASRLEASGNEPAGADATGLDALWEQVRAAAGRVDRAMIEALVPRSFDGRTLRIDSSAADQSIATMLRDRPAMLGDLVQRAVGRRVDVVVEEARSAGPARPPAPESVRSHPLVREAMEIFDGSVIGMSDDRGSSGPERRPPAGRSPTE